MCLVLLLNFQKGAKKMSKYLTWVFSVLNLAASVIVIVFVLPDTVATHFNLDFIPDAYGSKWTYLFIDLLPIVLTAAYTVYIAVISKNKTENKNLKIANIIIPLIINFLICVNWICLYAALNANTKDNSNKINPIYFIVILMGLLFVIMGNYMGKIKQNHTLGVRIAP